MENTDDLRRNLLNVNYRPHTHAASDLSPLVAASNASRSLIANKIAMNEWIVKLVFFAPILVKLFSAVMAVVDIHVLLVR